jgi:methylmalonyl-CoA/ethylmalonyl-CoA epimerase
MDTLRGVPVLRLHHLGVLVADLDEAMRFYRGVLGLSGGEPHDSATNDIRAILLDVGDSHIEVFAPLGPDGPVAKSLAKRGPGMHHVAYEVEDIDAALEQCRAAGIQLLDDVPRPGLHEGWRVTFLHPRSCGGVLTELIETGKPWPGVGI